MSAALMLGFVALILVGIPIAFAMGLASLLAIVVHGGLPFSLLAQRALVGADSYALLAIPFFILAGNLMNYGGITSRIIEFANAVVNNPPRNGPQNTAGRAENPATATKLALVVALNPSVITIQSAGTPIAVPSTIARKKSPSASGVC